MEIALLLFLINAVALIDQIPGGIWGFALLVAVCILCNKFSPPAVAPKNPEE